MWDGFLRQLRDRGYVVTHARERHRGPVTWVWGRYPAPLPFYLHFSNRDPVASAAGRFGIADIELGHPQFDAAYFLRSNRPDWARQFMTGALCDRLARFDSLQFCVSSIDNLLGADFFPGEKPRNLRDTWVLRTDGRLDETAAAPYAALAQELAESIRTFCAGRPQDAQAARAAAFEGR